MLQSGENNGLLVGGTGEYPPCDFLGALTKDGGGQEFLTMDDLDVPERAMTVAVMLIEAALAPTLVERVAIIAEMDRDPALTSTVMKELSGLEADLRHGISEHLPNGATAQVLKLARSLWEPNFQAGRQTGTQLKL
jgi:hypothetical protein